jgi:sirohydrochlorin ferrochelatase
MPSSSLPTGLVVVDHGSRNPEANFVVELLCLVVRSIAGDRYVAVQPAHMELADPSIADAVASCAEMGAERIVVAPFFLAPGRHVSEDVPRLAKEAAERFGIEVLVAHPLGADDRLAEVLLERAADATPRAICEARAEKR